MSRDRRAFISVDGDTIDRHLQGYGYSDEAPCPLIYQRALPRLLDLARDVGVPVTFFLLGRDAVAQRELLQRIPAEGHEVASHSWSHPQPLTTRSKDVIAYEVGASRAALSQASGQEVLGFRSPAWDIDDPLVDALWEAGYRYDASLFPSPAMLANRLSVALKGTGKTRIFEMTGLSHVWKSTAIQRIGRPGRELAEIPMTVSPVVRFPYYHTLDYLLPPAVNRAVYRSIVATGRPLSYVLHAVDLLGMSEDGVDRRMNRHPGMDRSLDEKLSRLRSVFTRIARDFDPAPMRSVLH
jgi:peptidoglycan/xylan/chitin deacetylase (PgdA/CDA1 family)